MRAFGIVNVVFDSSCHLWQQILRIISILLAIKVKTVFKDVNDCTFHAKDEICTESNGLVGCLFQGHNTISDSR